MRVTAIFHLSGVGGPSRSLQPVLAAIAERAELDVVFPAPGPAADQYRRLGRVHVGPYAPLTNEPGPRARIELARRTAREVRSFRADLRRHRPDLVIVVTTVLPAALLAARLEGVPAIVYAAELAAQPWKESPARRGGGALLVHATSRLADAIACCSWAVAEQFPARPGQSVAVAYPPIEAHHAQGDRARGRRNHGIGGDEHCIAVVGAISRGRGQDVAIRALPAIRERVPGARLLVVGAPHAIAVDHEYASELRALAAELGVGRDVVFAGTVERMGDVYAAADVVVNPARVEEAFGRVAAEALAAGVPVVSSRVGGVPEVLRDRVDALLVARGEPGELADAVVRLRADPERASAMAARGRERVLRMFTVDAAVAPWMRLVDAVAARQ